MMKERWFARRTIYRWTWAVLLVMTSLPALEAQTPGEKLIYPELDYAIVQLHRTIEQRDDRQMDNAFFHLRKVWRAVSGEIAQYDLPHFRFPEFVEVQELMLVQMHDDLVTRDRPHLQLGLQQFRRELTDLRSCLGHEYPLDILWQCLDLYEHVKYTVEDQMMDLREWYEFEAEVTDLFSQWDHYELLAPTNPTRFSPHFDLARQAQLNDQMAICKEEFLQSLEGGFRLDFVLPCHRVGETLESALDLYLSSKQVIGT